MKLTYHTDFPERLRFHQEMIDEFIKQGCEIVSDGDVVFNVDSIHTKGIKKGKKLTIYWEWDNYMSLGKNKELYDQANIVYVGAKFYLPFYPPGTKVLYTSVNPERMKEIDVPKFDYVYVGSIEPLPVYEDRIKTLDGLLRSGREVFITYGSQDDYVKNLSRGKIILNILPKAFGYTCVNLKVYEAMAVGCLMTDYNPILDEIAEKDIHYLTLDKFGQVSDEEIKSIKQASREHILKNHTIAHRVQQVIKDIQERL